MMIFSSFRSESRASSQDRNQSEKLIQNNIREYHKESAILFLLLESISTRSTEPSMTCRAGASILTCLVLLLIQSTINIEASLAMKKHLKS